MTNLGLNFSRAKITFTYSFMLEFNDKIRSLKELEEATNSIIKNNEKKFKLNTDTPHEGIISRINIRLKELDKENLYDITKFEFSTTIKDFMEKVSAQIRIFPTGAGTVSISFQLKKNKTNCISVQNIFEILDFVKSTSFQKQTTFKYNDKKTKLIDFFRDIIHEFLVPEKSFLGKKREPICKLICMNEKIINYQNSTDAQYPYLILDGQIEDSTRTAYNNELIFFDSLNEIEKTEITLLIQRYILGSKIDKQQLKEDIPKKVILDEKFLWFNHLFIGCHPKSTLFLYRKKDYTNDLFPVVYDGIIDLFEIIRARWFYNIIFNELLDKVIEKHFHVNNSVNMKYEIVLKELFLMKKKYSIFLSDPTTHMFEGGVLYDISKLAKEMYQLDYLKSLTNQKFDMIAQLVNDSIRINYV